jgi:antitoxin component YwqK of YwqJK toxin-antitoxin module
MKLPPEEMNYLLKILFLVIFLFAISVSLGVFTYKSFKKKKKKWILISSSLFFVVVLIYTLFITIMFVNHTLDNRYYNYSEISLKESKYYRNGNLFTGVSSYMNNSDSISIKIKDGKLEEKNTYKNHERVSREWYHENGNISYRTPYKNDKKEGIEEHFNENGSIWWRTTYKNDKKEGIEEHFNENGSIWWRTTYKNDKIEGIEEHFRENGSIWWRTTYKNDKKEGIEETYDENGSISRKEVYKNDKKVSEETVTNNSGNTPNVQTLDGVYTFESGYRRMKITISSEKWFGWLEDGSGDGNYSGKTTIGGKINGSYLYDEYGSEKRGYVSGNTIYYNDPLGEIKLSK